MTHDPLCQLNLCGNVECSARCDTNPCYCTCTYAASVRADEREQAAQRVLALTELGVWQFDVWLLRHAAAAVRGES